MKKLFSILGLAVLVTASLHYAYAAPSAQRHISLNQPFDLAFDEEVQVENYPVTIKYEYGSSGPSAAFLFTYPTGSQSVVFWENQPQSFHGASMVVTKFSDYTATIVVSAKTLPHAPGTNIKSADGTVWFINQDYMRQPYTSAGGFLSYGFNNFSSVVEANSADMVLPEADFIRAAAGRPVCSDRGTDKGTCYLVTAGKKAGFTSAAVFTGLGFKFNRVVYGDVSFLASDADISSPSERHRTGVLVNYNGTIGYVAGDMYLAIPSREVFGSWGFSFEDVVPANQADASLASGGILELRQPGQLTPPASAMGGPAAERDQQRLSTVRQLASALELYYNDFNRYPEFLNDLSPLYISQIPSAPVPIDGSCSGFENEYNYFSLDGHSYFLSFCLGTPTGGYEAGFRVLSPSGIQ